ncbi:hypothetical protein RCH20_000685 [Psychrobacter sp. PL15]|nr:hypothetical protein [Psychrobacter sp. PL15]
MFNKFLLPGIVNRNVKGSQVSGSWVHCKV